MDSIREILGAAVFLGVAAMFIWMLVGSVQNMISKHKTPVATVKARVSAKSFTSGSGEFGKSGLRSEKSVYTASFETENGGVSEFYIPKTDWDKLEENSTGYLTYRGNIWIGFEKDSLSEEIK